MPFQKGTYAQAMAEAFEDELRKIANVKANNGVMPSNKTLALVGAGAVGYEALRRAERDRRMGRAMRIQQQSY